MRLYCVLFLVVFLFSSCGKRECECIDDIQLTWIDELELDCATIVFSNAVINNVDPFVFVVLSKEIIDWEVQSLKLFQDDHILIDEIDLSEYVFKDHIIIIPNEIFSKPNEELITGTVHLEAKISFLQNTGTVDIIGSTFVYNREEVESDFDLENCKWSSQLIEFNNPC